MAFSHSAGFCVNFARKSTSWMMRRKDLDARRMSLDGIKRILDDFDEIYGDYQLSARVDMLLKFLAKRAAQEYRYISFQEKSPDNDAVQIMTGSQGKRAGISHGFFCLNLRKMSFPRVRWAGSNTIMCWAAHLRKTKTNIKVRLMMSGNSSMLLSPAQNKTCTCPMYRQRSRCHASYRKRHSHRTCR